METNKIVLDFPNVLKRITGNEYGYSIYKTQVYPKIDRNKKNEIYFPDNITGISISFIQGLMGDELIKYGKERIFDYFDFISGNADVQQSIIESIKF